MSGTLPAALAVTLRRLADLVAGQPILKYDRRYQLHVGHPYQSADGDLVLTCRPGTDEVYALVLAADGSVAAVEQVADASPDQLLTAAYTAAGRIADYTSWPLDDLPE